MSETRDTCKHAPRSFLSFDKYVIFLIHANVGINRRDVAVMTVTFFTSTFKWLVVNFHYRYLFGNKYLAKLTDLMEVAELLNSCRLTFHIPERSPMQSYYRILFWENVSATPHNHCRFH